MPASPKSPAHSPPAGRPVRSPLLTAAALVVVIYGLAKAQSIVVPIMVAVFLAIICAPAVRWLTRKRIPNAVAVLLVVAAIMLALAGVAAMVGGSAASFQESLPHYQERLGALADRVIAWLSSRGIEVNLAKILGVIEPGNAAKEAMDYFGKSLTALTKALSNLVLVGVTMILILLERATIPRKLRALSGDRQSRAADFGRIAIEVQRYLGIKSVLSLATGAVIAVWAAILDVDFALLWGLLAFLLNYIPNIGSIIAAIPACLLALIQHGPGTTLALGAGYLVVNMVVGNVLEPMWMGRRLGLSTVVVFLSLVIWGGILGPVGMLLSVPLTMVVKIMLQNSREWSFIAVLLDSGHGEEGKIPDTEPAGPAAPPEQTGAPSRARSTMSARSGAATLATGTPIVRITSARPADSTEPPLAATMTEPPLASTMESDTESAPDPYPEPDGGEP